MCTNFIVFFRTVRQHADLVIIVNLFLFQVDYDKTDNVYTKEKKPQNELDEHLKYLFEEYNHTRKDWHIAQGK